MSAASASDIAVSGVLRERRGIDDDDFRDAGGGELRRDAHPRRRRARHLERAAGLLRRRNRFPRRAIDATVTLFGNDEHHGCITLASSRRRLTELPRRFGRRAGNHLRLLAFLRKVHAENPLRRLSRAAAGATLRISFFFAAMIPLRVA